MDTFLAVFTGQLSDGPPPDEATVARGMQAWSDWMAKHAPDVLDTGGPLGRTKRVSRSGVEDVRNNLAGYVVVRAESHAAAAAMFEGHPHFTIFPGEGVDVMPCLAIPQVS
jgi:hypothetical protein